MKLAPTTAPVMYPAGIAGPTPGYSSSPLQIGRRQRSSSIGVWIVGGLVGFAASVVVLGVVGFLMMQALGKRGDEVAAGAPPYAAPGFMVDRGPGTSGQLGPAFQRAGSQQQPFGHNAGPYNTGSQPTSAGSPTGSSGNYSVPSNAGTYPGGTSGAGMNPNGSASNQGTGGSTSGGNTASTPTTSPPSPGGRRPWAPPPSTSGMGEDPFEPVTPATWALAPDPSKAAVELKPGSIKIPLTGPKVQIVFPAYPSRFVLAWNGDNSRPECTMYDLKTAAAVGKKPVIYGFQPKTAIVSDDGRYVVLHRTDQDSEPRRARITPFSFVTGEPLPRIDIDCAAFHSIGFAGPHTLVTAHTAGRVRQPGSAIVTLWDVQTGAKTKEIDLSQLSSPDADKLPGMAISPGGKYIAYPGEGEVVFVDLQQGLVLERAALPRDFHGQPKLIFSPDGRMLACLTDSTFRPHLHALDLGTGTVVVSSTVESSTFLSWRKEDIGWLPGNKGLLIDGTIIVELTSAKQAWSFPRPQEEPRRILRDGEMMTLAVDRTRYYLFGLEIPRDEISRALNLLRKRGGS